MNNNLKIWNNLYNVVTKWNKQQPWLRFESADWFQITFPDHDQPYYCSILGDTNCVYGLSIYTGLDGLKDLASLAACEFDQILDNYLICNQTCITFYMRNRINLFKEQKAIIEELNPSFSNDSKWPYFATLKKGYIPYHISDDDALLFIKIMEELLEIDNLYQAGKIDIRFNEGELLCATLQDEKWHYEAMVTPDVDPFGVMEFSDKQLLEKLSQAPKNDACLEIDLAYLNQEITEASYSKPLNHLVFLVFNSDTGASIHNQTIFPEDNNLSIVLDFVIGYILQFGSPKRIIFRNPEIWACLFELAERCNIDLTCQDLPLSNQYIEDNGDLF